jgi:Protein of unknown function (DUF4019)
MRRLVGWTTLPFAAVLCFAFSAHDVAWAQDPRGTLVQKTARDWLAVADRGDANASWNAAGKQFQNAITVERWAEGFKRKRLPLGAVVGRTTLSTEFTHTFAGAPDGDYAIVLFRTNFANKIDGAETVTLQREPDGNWRVIGYSIL